MLPVVQLHHVALMTRVTWGALLGTQGFMRGLYPSLSHSLSYITLQLCLNLSFSPFSMQQDPQLKGNLFFPPKCTSCSKQPLPPSITITVLTGNLVATPGLIKRL